MDPVKVAALKSRVDEMRRAEAAKRPNRKLIPARGRKRSRPRGRSNAFPDVKWSALTSSPTECTETRDIYESTDIEWLYRVADRFYTESILWNKAECPNDNASVVHRLSGRSLHIRSPEPWRKRFVDNHYYLFRDVIPRAHFLRDRWRMTPACDPVEWKRNVSSVVDSCWDRRGGWPE